MTAVLQPGDYPTGQKDYRRRDGRAQPRAPRRLPDLELYDSAADSGFSLSDDSENLFFNGPLVAGLSQSAETQADNTR